MLHECKSMKRNLASSKRKKEEKNEEEGKREEVYWKKISKSSTKNEILLRGSKGYATFHTFRESHNVIKTFNWNRTLFQQKSEGNVLDAWLPNKWVFFLWSRNYFHLAGELVYVVMAFRNDKQRKRKFPWRLLIIKYHVQWETSYRSFTVVWTLGKTGCTALINFTRSLSLSLSLSFSLSPSSLFPWRN